MNRSRFHKWGILFFCLMASNSCACTCADIPIAKQLDSADHVFHAFVERASIERNAPEGPWIVVELSEIVPYDDEHQIPFDTVRTHLHSSMCGSRVVVGEFYWFFTNDEGIFTKCSSTQRAVGEETAPLSEKIVDKLINLRREGKSPLNK